ncbi:phage repressor protein CI [Vibrio mangrovi]|uniref:Bacteriophage CI repressor helix-turn-helix domain protein n=1 Tax=Vibrio mangrovi TaxID=474394 RepID=A0A1Y6ITM8_9VIBR|nr:phage repressor protein CI [Vibrio mangrovi]MDW6004685.1 phage repressor protein CI [Vibrio mangrovi]SMS00976.1 Bacteriophage CI repressor helix-turn-helix domain protein [Vibrio mangrovi]
MTKKQVSLPPFDYLVGKQVTEKLCNILNVKSTRALSEQLNVPTSTFATWHKRNVCPYELAIRLHLHKGISLKWLLLDEGDPYPNAAAHDYQVNDEKKRLVHIDLFALKNGQLSHRGTMTLDQFFLDELEISNVIAIRDGEVTYLVDQESTRAVSGTYLIDVDGLLSINTIQRLPGKQLALNFDGSALTINESEVKVAGQIVLFMSRGQSIPKTAHTAD